MAITIKQTRVVDVPVTELRAAMDVACVATLLDAEGVVVGQSTTPAWLPQVLQIDLESGRITNWRAPSAEQLQAMADSQEVVPTMPADMVDVCEKYMPQMTNLVDVSHPATNTSTNAQPIDVAAPVQAVAVETAPESQQPKIIDIELPADFAVVEPDTSKESDHGWIAGLIVSVTEQKHGQNSKWSATTGHHTATSAQGKFEAINGVLSKAGMGRCEINQQKDEDGQPIEGMYLADDARTKDRKTVYISGHEVGKGHTARTSVGGKKYTAPTESAALDGLLSEVLNIELPADAIVDTTDDEMVFNDKQRFSIDMSKAAALPEVADIEPAPEAPAEAEDIGGRGPVKPRYQSPTGETWTGRGKQPAWLQAAIADGANINDFLIPTALLKKPLEIVPTPEPSAPPTYTDVMAAIEYAATEIHAAKLVNTINGGGFDFDQRTRLHAALNTRIKQIKAAELA